VPQSLIISGGAENAVARKLGLTTLQAEETVVSGD